MPHEGLKASCFEMNEKSHLIDQVSLQGGLRDSPGKMIEDAVHLQ